MQNRNFEETRLASSTEAIGTIVKELSPASARPATSTTTSKLSLWGQTKRPTSFKRLRVGVFGLGEQWQENMAPALHSLSDQADVTILCDSDEFKLEHAARRFPTARLYTDLRSAMECPLDAVLGVGPPQLHEELSLLALGKHIPVFVEKPPTLTLATLKERSHLAEELGVVTQVGHNFTHGGAFASLQHYQQMHGFNKICTIGVRYAAAPMGKRWGLSPLKSFLLSHACHAADFITSQVGVAHCVAVFGTIPRPGSVHILATVRSSNGISFMDLSSNATQFSFEACMDTVQGEQILFTPRSFKVIGAPGDPKRWERSWQPRPLESGHNLPGYSAELNAFFGAVASGRPAWPSFRDSIATYELLDEIESQLQEQGLEYF